MEEEMPLCPEGPGAAAVISNVTVNLCYRLGQGDVGAGEVIVSGLQTTPR